MGAIVSPDPLLAVAPAFGVVAGVWGAPVDAVPGSGFGVGSAGTTFAPQPTRHRAAEIARIHFMKHRLHDP